MDKFEALRHYFGYTGFRGGQEKLIDSVLRGRDVLGIMPTGGGKSICYQIPALLFDGITLVISPLISLMKDQVMALKDAGIPAAFLNSSLSYEQMQAVYGNLRDGKYKILYIAPERLETAEFLELASRLYIPFVAVDEAHCVSQWGNDFRPSYLGIADFVEALPMRPVVAAFTATATERVRYDITGKLRLQAPDTVITGFDRPNLNFEVIYPARKNDALLELIEQRKDKSGIIYCSTRSKVEKVCELLVEQGLPATRYHAGLSDIERQRNQEDFIYDRKPIIVATNAFGMGIDKSNVSYVVHYNMPMSLEAYYQEAGRAGRDGEPADCILLYSNSDIATARNLIEVSEPADVLSEEERAELRRRDYERLDRMVAYCKTTKCLRNNILDYFGQSHGENCENCGNCRTEFCVKDITIDAQKILSCVKRIYDKLGYAVGAVTVCRVLRGSEDRRIMELGLNTLTTYGIMKDMSRSDLKDEVVYLEDKGYLVTDKLHGGVMLTEKSRKILFEGEKLTMEYREAPKKESKRSKKQKALEQRKEAQSSSLFDALRALRFELASERKVPAYIIFTNAALADMAIIKPTTVEEFMQVSGVGKVKAEQYGEVFINLIKTYAEGE